MDNEFDREEMETRQAEFLDFLTDRKILTREALDGKISYTNSDCLHAIRHLHEIADPSRYLEMPYMLGIMGGCFAHACKWPTSLIDEIEEANDNRLDFELFALWSRQIAAYFQLKGTGMFDFPGVNLS